MSKITQTSRARRFDVIDEKIVRRATKIPAQPRIAVKCDIHNTTHLMSEGQIRNCNKK